MFAVTPHFCRHCGYNFGNDEPIERDGFEIHPSQGARYLGTPIRLTASTLSMLHTIASCDFPLPYSVVAARIGYEGNNFRNLVAVQRCRLMSRLREIKAPNPVKSVWGRGYEWRVK